MTLVLDASAAVELLLRTPKGLAVQAHVRDGLVVAPDLLDVETCSALARLERAGSITRAESDAAAHRLGRLPARRMPAVTLLAVAWSLRDRVRIADAFYVAAAIGLGASLLTCDARLGRAPLENLTVTLVR
ncbi:MAG: type II toxin-antitoxin system VapC family toxin [Geodermatophilaceae bacterium]|nr:type II toxin-antitoxin system VapC family toxin [Geodermatophilaceae bacterium]